MKVAAERREILQNIDISGCAGLSSLLLSQSAAAETRDPVKDPGKLWRIGRGSVKWAMGRTASWRKTESLEFGAVTSLVGSTSPVIFGMENGTNY